MFAQMHMNYKNSKVCMFYTDPWTFPVKAFERADQRNMAELS